MWEKLFKITCFVAVNALMGCLIGVFCDQEGVRLLYVACCYVVLVSILAFANV